MNTAQHQYREILRRDLYAFAHRAFIELNPQTKFLPNWHIEVLLAKLEAVRLGDIRRLVINVPPRGLKSHCASIVFPAWLLGHNPSAQIITVSYAQDLADKLARDCRALMSSGFYRALFPTRLSSQKQAVAEFETTKNGFRLSTSIGGVLTGRGADVIIIDDPLKPSEAMSELHRTTVNEWYDGTLYSRLNDKTRGAIVIVMQRLHLDDLVGHVLTQENWEVLSFPSFAVHAEAFGIETPYGPRCFDRKVGDVLHSEREPRETLERIRHISEYDFTSQYQQNPTPLGGAIIKREWLKAYVVGEEPAQFDEIIESWDTANKTSELSDFSVCTTWGVKDDFFFLLHVFRERLNYPELRRKVKELAERFHADTVVVEDKASGTQLVQDLKSDGVLHVEAYQPPTGTDKIMRLRVQSAVFESGHVLLPEQAPWLGDYVNELTGFPGTRYNDQVDSTTQALDYARKLSGVRIFRKLGSMGPFEGFDAICPSW